MTFFAWACASATSSSGDDSGSDDACRFVDRGSTAAGGGGGGRGLFSVGDSFSLIFSPAISVAGGFVAF